MKSSTKETLQDIDAELAAAVARTETARQTAARIWLGLGR